MRWPLFRVAVAERSMQPALEPGDWLVVLRTTRAKPGQVVISVNPEKPDMLLVKRLRHRLPDGAYWLESDNQAAGAVDSRRFGPVTAIAGRVLFRYRRARG